MAGFSRHDKKTMKELNAQTQPNVLFIKKSSWISIQIMLPDLGVTVLVCLSSKLITCAYRSNRNGFKTWHLYGDIEKIHDVDKESITHWQYLPDPA